MTAPFHHIPIMVEPVLALLAPERGGIFVDGTLGAVSYTHLPIMWMKRPSEEGNHAHCKRPGIL